MFRDMQRPEGLAKQAPRQTTSYHITLGMQHALPDRRLPGSTTPSQLPNGQHAGTTDTDTRAACHMRQHRQRVDAAEANSHQPHLCGARQHGPLPDQQLLRSRRAVSNMARLHAQPTTYYIPTLPSPNPVKGQAHTMWKSTIEGPTAEAHFMCCGMLTRSAKLQDNPCYLGP